LLTLYRPTTSRESARCPKIVVECGRAIL
jgi:hypothetical protein